MYTRLSGDMALNTKIELENLFIVEYMPAASGDYVKVYLYGLSLALRNPDPDNSSERIARRLGLEAATVIAAFKYWDDCGLVRYTEEGVTYLPITEAIRVHRKINKDKFKDFNRQLEAIIKRPILPNEYYEYYGIMETLNIEWQAMVEIITYCVKLKGEAITYPYILTVARNLAAEGCISFDHVSKRLEEYELYNPDLTDILKALKSRRTPDHEDKRLYIKWTKVFCFDLATIIKVAKDVKRGGTERLDALLTKYYENKLLSYEEIRAYNDNISSLRELAKNINRALGLYYENVDVIVETYLNDWLALGFDYDALLTIAGYCFKHNTRSLEGMNESVQKFYQKGILTVQSLDNFAKEALIYDGRIKEILEKSGVSRIVTSRDRDSYRTWIHNWKIQEPLIDLAASMSYGKANPISYMNSIIGSWHEKGIQTLESAKAAGTPLSAAPAPAETEAITYKRIVQSIRDRRRERLADAAAVYEQALSGDPILFDIHQKLTAASIEGNAKASADLKKKRAEALERRGLSADVLEPPYECERCQDTGYFENRFCDCVISTSQSDVSSGQDTAKQEVSATVKEAYTAEELNALFDSLDK